MTWGSPELLEVGTNATGPQGSEDSMLSRGHRHCASVCSLQHNLWDLGSSLTCMFHLISQLLSLSDCKETHPVCFVLMESPTNVLVHISLF